MPKLEIISENISISENKQDGTVFHIQGFIDAPNYDRFVSSVQKEIKSGSKYVIMDFTSLAYINSTGISALRECSLSLSFSPGTGTRTGSGS